MCEIEFMPYFVVWTRTGCSVPSLPRFTHSFIQYINKLKTDLKLVYTSFKTTKYTAYTHPHYTLSLRIAFVINDLKFGKYWSPIFSYLFPHSTPILFLYCFPFVKKFVILLFSLCLFLPFPGFLLSFLKFLKSGLIVPLACEYIAIGRVSPSTELSVGLILAPPSVISHVPAWRQNFVPTRLFY